MNKTLVIGILIVLVFGVGSWFYFYKYQLPLSVPGDVISGAETNLPAKKLPPPVHILSDRTEKFSISSGEGYPVFLKELIVDPFKVKEGEEQYFSIWAKDPAGIAKVIATIKTDKEDKTLALQLVEGTKEEGRWEGFWLTNNISLSDNYPTEFQAVNKNNQDRKSTIFWYLSK